MPLPTLPLPALPPRPLLAVSGGADSVALLRLAAAQGVPDLSVAHVDHRLRPESPDDAAFVQALCAGLGVPCAVLSGDALRLARARGRGPEEAARVLRYSLLSRQAKAVGAGGIVLAHTRGDQAETVLWQLLRGETPRGMPPQRGRVWRPLLETPRAALREHLTALGQPWREDPSNRDTARTRAWLRREVLPELAARFPEAEAMLARVARFTREDDAALQGWAARLSGDNLPGQPGAVLRRRVRAELGAARRRAGPDAVAALAGALQTGETRHLGLPGGHPASASGGRLHLEPVPAQPPPFAPPPGLEWRCGRPGDRLRTGGGGRKVSDLLGEARVPREARPGVWRLAAPGSREVLWLHTDPPVLSVDAPAHGLSEPPEVAAMRRALLVAREGAAAGEVPVGAVLMRGPEVVATARNRSREAGDMTAHAELLVLQAAAQRLGPYLNDCTLFVTLEPCPMCCGAMLEARLGRVVYGARNPKMGALGGVTDLREAHFGHRLEVRGGLLEREAGRLLRDFFAGLRRE